MRNDGEQDSTRLEKLIRGRAVLELGSGLGYVGCALAALGARRVLCTDVPTQLKLLEFNIQQNATALGRGAAAVGCTPFVWGTRPAAVFQGPYINFF